MATQVWNVDRQLLSLEETLRYVDGERLVAEFVSCGSHQVTTCEGCGGLWELGQLRHPVAGYYPGEPGSPVLTAVSPGVLAQPSTNSVGNRYKHVCPTCGNDLTDLVELHIDACQLARR